MVPMISVARFCQVLRISGPVEKMPRTGPGPSMASATGLEMISVPQVRLEVPAVRDDHEGGADHRAQELAGDVHRDVVPLA